MGPLIRWRFFVTLVLVLLPVLSLSRSAAGQTFVTSTVTTLVTNSQSSTITVQPSIATSTTPQSLPIFSASITLQPSRGGCGEYFVQPFNATAGEDLSGTLSSDGEVDFYVMATADFQTWNHQAAVGGKCLSPTAMLSEHGTTFFNFTSKIAHDGSYQIIVNNVSNSTVTAYLMAELVTAIPVPVTNVVYSTLTQSTVQTLTLITLLGLPEESSSQNSIFLTSVIGLCVVVILIAFFARARRSRSN